MSDATAAVRARPPSDERDLLKEGVTSAAGALTTRLLGFMTISVYLGVTALSTSQDDLLAGRIIHLPVFDVELPLVSFYVLAPVAYLALHLAVLAQALLVARRLGLYATVLGRTDATMSLDERVLRLWLVAPQSLVPPPRQATGADAAGHRPDISGQLLAALPLVVVPIGLLMLMQQRFLAYGSTWVPVGQFAVILADITAVMAFWTRLTTPVEALRLAIGAGAGSIRFNVVRHVPHAAAVIGLTWGLCLLLKPQVVEAWYRLSPETTTSLRRGGDHAGITIDRDVLTRRLSLLACLGGPDVAAAGEEAWKSALWRHEDQPPFCRREKLTGAGSAVLHETALKVPPSIDLRRRNLHRARLAGVDLAGVDLTGADLSGADLAGADLRGARLVRSDLRQAVLDHASLELADLSEARLAQATARYADLQGARLYATKLEGADLTGAHLQFLVWNDPSPTAERPATLPPLLRSANLTGVQLQGTDLKALGLPGTALRGAQMQASDLSAPRTDGADLTGAVSDHPHAPDEEMPARGPDPAGDRYCYRMTGDGGDDENAWAEDVDFSGVYYDAALVLSEATWGRVSRTVLELKRIEPHCWKKEPDTGVLQARQN